jgi:hypothetical protein
MPRYYFHIRDAKGLIEDGDGMELASLRRAIEEAEASAASLNEQRKYAPSRCSIEVTDEQGLILAVVPVSLPS